jgi:hypothetical protein
VGRVDGQRGEHGEHAVAEPLGEAPALGVVQAAPAHDLDSLLGQRGEDLVPEDTGLAGHEVARALPDGLDELARGDTAGPRHGDPRGDAPLQPGDAHHVELVEVAGEDREELGPLEHGRAGVLGELEHPLVERQPAELAVSEAAVRQRLGFGPGLARGEADLQGRLAAGWLGLAGLGGQPMPLVRPAHRGGARPCSH